MAQSDPTPPSAEPRLWSVSGRVVHDLDGDGVLEPGEPGLAGWDVCARVSVHQGVCYETKEDGSYSLGLGFGNPDLDVPLSVGPGDPDSRRPTPLDPRGREWRQTTPQPTGPNPRGFVITEASLQGSERLDFGLRRSEFMELTGALWADAGLARHGALVEAKIGDRLCARSTGHSRVYGQTEFALTIPAAEEHPGCGTPGATMRFYIDGRQANERFSWTRSSDEAPARVSLTVGPAFAAYSGTVKTQDGREPPQGLVQAYVDGTLCGELVWLNYGNEFGWPTKPLILPSAEFWSGCGVAGAEVTFIIAGVEAVERIEWRPGFQELSLTVPDGVE